LFANDDIHFNAPLATLISKEMSDRLTQLHGTLFNVILLMIWIHVVAVCFYLFVKSENLIKQMFTGDKDTVHVPSGSNLRFTHPIVALLLWALSAGIVWWIVRP
jgi:cytochrome b